MCKSQELKYFHLFPFHFKPHSRVPRRNTRHVAIFLTDSRKHDLIRMDFLLGEIRLCRSFPSSKPKEHERRFSEKPEIVCGPWFVLSSVLAFGSLSAAAHSFSDRRRREWGRTRGKIPAHTHTTMSPRFVGFLNFTHSVLWRWMRLRVKFIISFPTLFSLPPFEMAKT